MVANYDDLLEELKRLAGPDGDPTPEDAKTVEEWAAYWNVGVIKARKLLEQLKSAGKLTWVRVHRERLDGGKKVVTVFSLQK